MEKQAEKLVKLVKEKKKRSKCKILSFVSGKGGVGKTTISTSFAYILANVFNRKVLLLDCDFGLGNIHLLLGLDPNKNLRSVLRGGSLKNATQTVLNFNVVLGFSGIESIEELESYESANLLVQLDNVIGKYDFVILDNSAGLSRFTANFSRAASETYIITTPEPTALTDAYAFIKTMHKLYDYQSFKVIINMVHSHKEGFETFERLNSSTMKFLGLKLKLAGILPLSHRIRDALRKNKPMAYIYPSDPFSVELKKIAQLEVGEAIPEKEEGFIKRFFRFLKEGT